jgi:hypothetical protein
MTFRSRLTTRWPSCERRLGEPIRANRSAGWLITGHLGELFGEMAPSWSASSTHPRETWLAVAPVRHTWTVGFNPFRPQRRRTSDYAFVAAAFVVIAALLVWAFLPR